MILRTLVIPALLVTSLSCLSHPGVGIVMDSKGQVYYTDLVQVWKIDLQGKKSVAVRNVHTHELFIDEHDTLFGEHLWYEGERTDKWGHYVWKFSADGKFEKVIPDSEGFLTNYSFVRNHQGTMFWPNREDECQHIVKKSKEGRIQVLSRQCMSNIRNMTISPQGMVYCIDFQTLKKVDQSGNVITIASLKEDTFISPQVSDLHYVMGLCVDENENIYTAVYGARKVVKVTSTGKKSTHYKTGLIWSPTGVLSAPNGDFWILECSPTNAVRVECITADGRRIIY